MMEKYDPHQAPDPDEWNEVDESERILLVQRYHRRKHIRLPNEVLHATIHAIVENQVAMGDKLNVAATVDRLMSEGLNRHEAIHAIGSVLAERLYTVLGGGATAARATPEATERDWASRLDKLSAEEWRNMGEQED